jgi:rod shape-determining protein MreD
VKRKLSIGILCVLAAFLQTTVLSHFEVASIRPNLQVILTASFALMCGSRTGMAVGFVSGILLDITGGGILGYYALLYSWVGYLAGYSYRIFYDDDIKTPLLLIGVCDVACGIFQYVSTFLIRGRIHFLFYLGRVIIPEMIYTVIFAVFLYQLNYYVNKKTMGTYY